GGPGVAAHVLRLRLDLLIGSLRGRTSDVARTVGGFLALALVVTVVCAGLLQLTPAPVDVAGVVTVLAGAGIALGYLMAPLVAAWEDPLDPRRFIVFGIEPRSLIVTLLPASLVSVSAF